MSRACKQGLLLLPSIGASILPKLVCPICSPIYAGLLAALGLGFVVTRYLMPVTAVFLTLALWALAFRAKSRQGYGPFQLGLTAAIAILLTKFVWEYTPATYAAIALLVLASVWNAWPCRTAPASCQIFFHRMGGNNESSKNS
jgi:hypothetical protein